MTKKLGIVTLISILVLICIVVVSANISFNSRNSAAAVYVPVAGGVPVLESNPSASVKIFLDFDGNGTTTYRTTATGFAATALPNPALDRDGIPSTFNEEELETINEVWTIVADKFSPFNVDVTTKDPSPTTHVYPDGVSMHVIIGGGGAWNGSAVWGQGVKNAFTESWAENNVYCFSENLAGMSRDIAASINQHLGRAFGISDTYYQYTENGVKFSIPNWEDGIRNPIVGRGLLFNQVLQTWWYGYNPLLLVTQDDMSIITSATNGITLRQDDHSNSSLNATALINVAGKLTGKGIIEQATSTEAGGVRGDVDYFTFTTTQSGTVTVSVKPTAVEAMLDPVVELRNGTNASNIIATADMVLSTSPVYTNEAFSDNITTTLPAGTYYVVVHGHGPIPKIRSGQTVGYYVDAGQYTVSVTPPSTTPPANISVPALSSNPTATAKIYLDFNGDPVGDTQFNNTFTTPAYDKDGNPANFSAAEISDINQIWDRVSEKFAPFNIDVTTVDPSPTTGLYNNGIALQVLIGGDGTWIPTSNGTPNALANHNSFYSTATNRAWVFPVRAGNPFYVSEAAARVIARSFGLNYHVIFDRTTLANQPNPGTSTFGIITSFVGSAGAKRGVWWNGASTFWWDSASQSFSSITYQDDLAYLDSKFGYRADDRGDTKDTATPLSVNGTNATASGIIERLSSAGVSDIDFYSFNTSGGSVTIDVKAPRYSTDLYGQFGVMLDPKFVLLNSAGVQIASADSASLDESLTQTLSAGTYYIGVSGHGTLPVPDANTPINAGYDVGKYAINVTLPATVAVLPAPTGLTATASTGQIALSWNSVTGATSYNVYRSTTSGTETLLQSGVTTNSFTNSGLSNDTTYFYKIAAVNSAGVGSLSSEASATTPIVITVPGQVFNLTAGASGTQVTLTWTAVAGAASYNIYRSTSSGSETLLQSGVTATTYANTGLANGTTYYYKVAAVNSAGVGPMSSEVSATTPIAAPGQVTGVTAVASANQIVVNWSAVAGATSYTIYRSTISGAETQYQAGLTGTSFTNISLADGTTYYYKVAAVNAAGTGQLSAEASATTPIGVPTRVGSLGATGGLRQVALSWSSASGATSYNIYRSTTAGNESLSATGVTGTSFTDNSLNNGTTYYYTVAGVNTAGVGPQSTEVSASTTSVPPQVTGVTAGVAGTTITLNWNPISGVTSYNIYRSTSSGNETLLQSGVTSTSFNNTGLTSGTTYYYKVAAVNAAGVGGLSVEVSATTPVNVPAQVTGVTATGGLKQVSLSWNATVGADSYNLYRSTSSGSETLINSGIISTSFTNTNLADGTRYYYKVAAVNASGAGALSSEVSATTVGAPAQVTGVTVRLGIGKVQLNWNSVTGATAYRVYRSTTAGGAGTMVGAGITGTTFTNMNLVNGTPYYYRVEAINGTLVGQRSVEVSATPLSTLPQPTSVSLTSPSTATVKLSWAYPNYIFYGFKIQTSIDNGVTWLDYTQVGPDIRSITKSMVSGKVVRFKVAAMNTATSVYSYAGTGNITIK